MEKKYTVEELEQQCLEAEKHFKFLHEQLDKAKKEEEETRQEKLRAEKEARIKEVNEAFEKWDELRKRFISDYGYYSTSTSESFKDIDSIIEKLYKFRWF